MVWDSVVWHGVVLPNLWDLASCVCGVGEGCGGIVVGDGGFLTQWYAACFCGKANL